MYDFEIVLGVLGLIGLVCILAVPFLLVSHLGLKSKVRSLEQLVLRGTAAQATQSQPAMPPAINARDPVKARAPTLPTAVRAAPVRSEATAPTLAHPSQPHAVMPAPTGQDEPPKAYVFKPDLIDKLTAWLRENWVLAIAAASLALAGVFMVQYGIEAGLLTPFWRVMGAFAFGAALIAGGEYIRRNGGNDEQDGDAVGATRHLPSTLSGAGIIVLYVAVFSARALYGLIDPLTTLFGLAAVSAVALVLGWFYGPFLAAVGILGATVAPFIVGSSSNNSWMVHYYLALIAVTALGVDTIKRWAWVSAFGLLLTLGANTVLYAARGADLHFLAATLLIAFAAFTIPERGLIPRQSGTAFLDALRLRFKQRPAFPTRLTFGTTVAATLAAVMVLGNANTPDTVWLALIALMLLLTAVTIWAREAPALYDHALIPGSAFLLAIALESMSGPLFREFRFAAQPVADGPATAIPLTVWILAALGATGTLMMFARMNWSLQSKASAPIAPTFWALSATVFAPATLLILEFLWSPGTVLGPYPWALAAIAMAALMTFLASRAATAPDAGRPLRAGLFAVGALTLITLAIFLVMTKSALTVALAVMVLATTVLDKRTPLPPLTWFIQIAVAIITFRLVVWPGLDWALELGLLDSTQRVPYFEVAFAYLATLGLLAAAWWISRDQRAKTALVLESASWTILGIFLVVTLMRAVSTADTDTHWVMGLMSTIWVALALNQLYRMRGGSRFGTILRSLLAGLYSLTALGSLIALFTALSPFSRYGGQVIGPPIFDSLALAYLPLAIAFAIGAWKITHLGRLFRLGFTLLASLFTMLYIGTEIRRLWRGRDLTVPGFSDPELYTYTLAMLIGSVALLVFAFSRRSDTLRKIAMAGVALTVAKVFLVDMSGLSGLIRVMSFMGLGLSLVGLAWLNRKMTAQWDKGTAIAEPTPEDA